MPLTEIIMTGIASLVVGGASGAFVMSKGLLDKKTHGQYCPENRNVMLKTTHDKDCPVNRDLLTKKEHEVHCNANALLVMAKVKEEIAPVRACVRAIAREMDIDLTGEM